MLIRDSYINFTLFNIFPYVCGKCGTTYFKQNAKLKNNLQKSYSFYNDNLTRHKKIRTNVTPTGKTRNFVDQCCFILTNESFPTVNMIKYQKSLTQVPLFFYAICNINF